MERVRELFRKFQSMDGRIKIGTLSGVAAVAAVIALFVGVLPAGAVAGPQLDADVPPDEVNYGGGNGGCAFVGSAATNELHVNNPTDGTFTDGTISITIDVYESDTLFSFTVNTPGYAVYDVTVNGGAKSNHYDYDDGGSGPVGGDEDLHAPQKGNGQIFNLSHINFCYDIQLFFCDGQVTSAILLNEGDFTNATAQLLDNSEITDCIDKDGVFYIDETEGGEDYVALEFGDGPGIVALRFDYTKKLSSQIVPDLQYSLTLGGDRSPLSWCIMRPKVALDGDEFDNVIPANQDGDPSNDMYPTNNGVTDDLFPSPNPGDAIACKVAETENANGHQKTTGYGEFDDPFGW